MVSVCGRYRAALSVFVAAAGVLPCSGAPSCPIVPCRPWLPSSTFPPCVQPNTSVFSFWLLGLASSSQRLTPGILRGWSGARVTKTAAVVPPSTGVCLLWTQLGPAGARALCRAPGCGRVPWDMAAACLCCHRERNLSVLQPLPKLGNGSDLPLASQDCHVRAAAGRCLRARTPVFRSRFRYDNWGCGKMLPPF